MPEPVPSWEHTTLQCNNDVCRPRPPAASLGRTSAPSLTLLHRDASPGTAQRSITEGKTSPCIQPPATSNEQTLHPGIAAHTCCGPRRGRGRDHGRGRSPSRDPCRVPAHSGPCCRGRCCWSLAASLPSSHAAPARKHKYAAAALTWIKHTVCTHEVWPWLFMRKHLHSHMHDRHRQQE